MSNCCVHVFVLHMLVGIGLAVNGLPVYMFNNWCLSNGWLAWYSNIYFGVFISGILASCNYNYFIFQFLCGIGDGAFNVAGIENFMKEVKLSECGLSYAVVSIMGPQSRAYNSIWDHFSCIWFNCLGVVGLSAIQRVK